MAPYGKKRKPPWPGSPAYRAAYPKRYAAGAWLLQYLYSVHLREHEWPTPNQVKAAARAAGLSERTLRRAKHDIGVPRGRTGFGPGSYYRWRLPDARRGYGKPTEAEGGDASRSSVTSAGGTATTSGCTPFRSCCGRR